VVLSRALAIALAGCALARAARADCVDPVEQKKLIESKRVTRAAVDRDFIKAGRHEISVMGGYYVSDLFDGTFVLTGAYTYHLTEDVGVEGSFGWSRVHSSVAAKLEADHSVTVLPPEDRVFLVFANAVYAPLHGKAQIFTDAILHFDLYGSLGVGLIDNSTSLGAAGQAGVGIKMFLGKAFALRLDARDQIYRQQVLGTRQYVSDFQVTLGVSLFLPPSP
jgi:outer membrane beta-barrel protein